MIIKVLDTFAGVGGFSLALEKAIWKENIEHIWFSEIDKFAKEVYKNHFQEVPDLWDITKINISELPKFDLLTGGLPCQDVSVAWKQNLEGWRTVLVEYLLKILEEKQPKIMASRGRYNKDGSTSQNLEARKDDLTNTLTSVEKDNILLEKKEVIRKLTPTEYERLQGFPDGWSTKYVSNTQAYKQMGNAISVPVVENIFINLFKHIYERNS